MTDSLIAMTARELVRRMRDGSVSATEVMAAHFGRIDAAEPSIRAWAFLDREGAMAAAMQADAMRRAGRPLGALHGLPVGVKDIIDTEDMPTTFGSSLYAGRRPSRDATLVARLRAAGAILIGKTVTSDLALFVAGPTRNPHDLARTPGGSSSGSAAAVAALMAPIALATQTNGSIVRPASYCGAVGYKPSLGVLPRTGILRHSIFLDQPGVIARDVADAAFVVDAMAGRDDADETSLSGPFDLLTAAEADAPPPRLGFARGPYWLRATEETRAAIEALAARLPARVEAVDLSASFDSADETLGVLMSAGVAQTLAADFETRRDRLPPPVAAVVGQGRALSAVSVLDALARREELRGRFTHIAAPYDAILTAASIGVAPLASQGTGDPIFATSWSLIGVPSLSLPMLAGPSGLPLGLQVVGRPRGDRALLRAASWLMRQSS